MIVRFFHVGILLAALPGLCLAQTDTVPPVLTAFDFNPRSVDATAGPAPVTCRISATDAPGGTGIGNASCRFRSPSGNVQPVCYADHLSSGTIYDGVWTCDVTIPQFSEAGTWDIYEVVVVDRASNYHSYNRAQLEQMGLPARLQVTSAYDVEGPILDAFDFAPKSIDVTTDPAQVSFTLSLSDVISGVSYAGCNLHSPGGSTWTGCQAQAPSSGTIHDGVWGCTVAMPQNAEPGIWVVESLQLTDVAGNSRFYDAGTLVQRGFPTELLVASGRDVVPPVLTALDLDPRSVDVIGGPAAVACEVSATDATSGVGVQSTVCSFRTADGTPGPFCRADHPSSGDIYDGVWICSLTIPQFVEPGTWVVSEVDVTDGASNIHEYRRAELELMGFPVDFQVFSNHDVVPPDLTAFDFNPRSVDVLNGPASVTCAMRFTDELAGVQAVECDFHSPSVHAGAYCYALLPSSGTINDGAWTCTITLPQGTEQGTWLVGGLQVVDKVGNIALYGTSDLDQRGYATRLEVTADQAAPDSDGDGVIDTADACPNSILGATVSIGEVDSGVPNARSPSGCTLADRVSQCLLEARNQGGIAGCVRQSCARFENANPAGRMQCNVLGRAAARSHAGKPRRSP